MNTHAEWIEIDQSNPVEDVKKAPSGVTVHMVVSQHDRPREARAYLSDDGSIIHVEFRYLSSEPTRNVEISDRVSVCLGKKSKRVYGLSIQGPLRDADQIKVDVDAALARLDSDVLRKTSAHFMNYVAARRAFDEEISSLIPAIAAG